MVFAYFKWQGVCSIYSTLYRKTEMNQWDRKQPKVHSWQFSFYWLSRFFEPSPTSHTNITYPQLIRTYCGNRPKKLFLCKFNPKSKFYMYMAPMGYRKCSVSNIYSFWDSKIRWKGAAGCVNSNNNKVLVIMTNDVSEFVEQSKGNSSSPSRVMMRIGWMMAAEEYMGGWNERRILFSVAERRSSAGSGCRGVQLEPLEHGKNDSSPILYNLDTIGGKGDGWGGGKRHLLWPWISISSCHCLPAGGVLAYFCSTNESSYTNQK